MSIHFIHTMNLNFLSSNPTAVACDLGHKRLIIQTSLTDNAEHVKVDGRGPCASDSDQAISTHCLANESGYEKLTTDQFPT